MKVNNSVLGAINPGVRMYAPVGNPNITNVKSLEEIAAIKPEVMFMHQRWYLEHADPFIRQVLMLGGYYDFEKAVTMRSDEQGDFNAFDTWMKNSTKRIDVNKFRFPLPMMGKQILFFTRPAEGQLNENGVFAGSFYVYVSTNELAQNETIILPTQPINQNILIQRVISTGQKLNNGRYETKLMVKPAHGQTVNPKHVKKNNQFSVGYNIASEDSSRGARPKSEGYGSFWRENNITTMRWETGITGHAQNSKINNKYIFQYISPEGQAFNYWIDYQIHQKNLQKTRQMAQYILNGQRFSKTGEFRDEETGNLMISGDGILAQTNPKLRRPYQRLTLQLFEEQTELMLRDDPNYNSLTGKPKIMIPVPLQSLTSLSKELTSIFGVNPAPLYKEEEGGKWRGIDMNMNMYKTPLADYYFIGHNMWNSRNQPLMYDDYGQSISQNTIMMMNMSSYENGASNVFLVSNREPIVNAVYKGMATAKSGEQLSTRNDRTELHDLSSIGVGVPNPNCLSLLYKAQ